MPLPAHLQFHQCQGLTDKVPSLSWDHGHFLLLVGDAPMGALCDHMELVCFSAVSSECVGTEGPLHFSASFAYVTFSAPLWSCKAVPTEPRRLGQAASKANLILCLVEAP